MKTSSNFLFLFVIFFLFFIIITTLTECAKDTITATCKTPNQNIFQPDKILVLDSLFPLDNSPTTTTTTTISTGGDDAAPIVCKELVIRNCHVYAISQKGSSSPILLVEKFIIENSIIEANDFEPLISFFDINEKDGDLPQLIVRNVTFKGRRRDAEILGGEAPKPNGLFRVQPVLLPSLKFFETPEGLRNTLHPTSSIKGGDLFQYYSDTRDNVNACDYIGDVNKNATFTKFPDYKEAIARQFLELVWIENCSFTYYYTDVVVQQQQPIEFNRFQVVDFIFRNNKINSTVGGMMFQYSSVLRSVDLSGNTIASDNTACPLNTCAKQTNWSPSFFSILSIDRINDCDMTASIALIGWQHLLANTSVFSSSSSLVATRGVQLQLLANNNKIDVKIQDRSWQPEFLMMKQITATPVAWFDDQNNNKIIRDLAFGGNVVLFNNSIKSIVTAPNLPALPRILSAIALRVKDVVGFSTMNISNNDIFASSSKTPRGIFISSIERGGKVIVNNNRLSVHCPLSDDCMSSAGVDFYGLNKNFSNGVEVRHNFINASISRSGSIASTGLPLAEEFSTTCSGVQAYHLSDIGPFFDVSNNNMVLYVNASDTRAVFSVGFQILNDPEVINVDAFTFRGNKIFFSGYAHQCTAFGFNTKYLTNCRLIAAENNVVDMSDMRFLLQPMLQSLIRRVYVAAIDTYTQLLPLFLPYAVQEVGPVIRLQTSQSCILLINTQAPDRAVLTNNSLIVRLPGFVMNMSFTLFTKGGSFVISSRQKAQFTWPAVWTSFNSNFSLLVSGNNMTIVDPSILQKQDRYQEQQQSNLDPTTQLYTGTCIGLVFFGGMFDDTAQIRNPVIIENNRLESKYGGVPNTLTLLGNITFSGGIQFRNNVLNIRSYGKDTEKTSYPLMVTNLVTNGKAPEVYGEYRLQPRRSSLVLASGLSNFIDSNSPLLVINNSFVIEDGYGSLSFLSCTDAADRQCVRGNLQFSENTVVYSTNPNALFPINITALNLASSRAQQQPDPVRIQMDNNVLTFSRNFNTNNTIRTETSFLTLTPDFNKRVSGSITLTNNTIIVTSFSTNSASSTQTTFVALHKSLTNSFATSASLNLELFGNNLKLLQSSDFFNVATLEPRLKDLSFFYASGLPRIVPFNNQVQINAYANPNCNKIYFRDQFTWIPDFSGLSQNNSTNVNSSQCGDHEIIVLGPTTSAPQDQPNTSEPILALPSFSAPLETGTNVAQGASMVFSATAASVVPSMGFGISRQQAMIGFVQNVRDGDCSGISEADAVSVATADSPTHMAIGNTVAKLFSGGAVGNTLLTFGFVVIGELGGIVFLKNTGSSSWNRPYAVFARCHVAMILFVCLSLLFAPTIKFSLVTIALPMSDSTMIQKVLVVIFGILIFGGVTTFFVCWALFIRDRRESYHKFGKPSSTNKSNNKKTGFLLTRAYDFWFEGPGEWRMPYVNSKQGKGLTEKHQLDFDAATPMLDGYQGHAWWFAAFEFVIQLGLAIADFLANVVPTDKSCLTQAVVLIVVLTAYLLLCVWKRPFQELFNQVSVPIITCFQIAVVAIAIAFGGEQPDFIVTLALLTSSLQSVATLIVLLTSLSPLAKQVLKIFKRIRKSSGRSQHQNTNLRDVFRSSFMEDLNNNNNNFDAENNRKLLERPVRSNQNRTDRSSLRKPSSSASAGKNFSTASPTSSRDRERSTVKSSSSPDSPKSRNNNTSRTSSSARRPLPNASPTSSSSRPSGSRSQRSNTGASQNKFFEL